MYIVKRYSASGLYSGEPVESFEELSEAIEYLEKKAKRFNSKTNAKYYQVSLSDDRMHLEVYSDYGSLIQTQTLRNYNYEVHFKYY